MERLRIGSRIIKSINSTLNFIFCGYMIFAVIFLLDMIWLGIFGLQGLPW